MGACLCQAAGLSPPAQASWPGHIIHCEWYNLRGGTPSGCRPLYSLPQGGANGQREVRRKTGKEAAPSFRFMEALKGEQTND